jgi:hypothetical protein
MTRGGDEMAVACKEIEIIKTRVRRESVGHVAAHAAAGLEEHLIQQAQAALAFEALKEGGHADGRVVEIGELLEEIPTALEDPHAAADTGFHPSGIIKSGAFPAVFGGMEKLEKGLEEFFTDD